MGESQGLVKFVADQDGVILGATIMGPWATELIAEVVVAMQQSLTAKEFGRIVHAHPTLSEAIKEAALAVDGQAIHIAPPRRR